MKIPLELLSDEHLARAVAMALGYRVERDGQCWAVWLPADAPADARPCASFTEYGWRPDLKDGHGGPLIDREKIGTLWDIDEGRWCAGYDFRTYESEFTEAETHGATRLEAAMRSLVLKRMGPVVDLPD